MSGTCIIAQIFVSLNGITNAAKYFPCRSPQGPWGQKVKIKLYQNIAMLHIKGNCECSNMVANADRGTINKKHIKPDF